MRFLPNTFDVLTNAQMKTFDGNPLEHSPASAHTDHAIMGYEYEFKILTADHVWITKKTIKSGFCWRPEEIWAEIDGAWTESLAELRYADMVKFFKQLKNDGFTGISLDMSYYIDSLYDNALYELQTRNPNIADWEIRTPTLEELNYILKAISQAGLNAKVLPMFYVSKSYIEGHGFSFNPKFMIDPQDPELFFEHYAKLLEKIIPVLNKYGVKSLTVSDETDTINVKYAPLIERLLTRLSGEFNGRPAIDSAINNIMTGMFPTQTIHSWRDAIDRMTFWGWTSPSGVPLDIEYSCWAPPIDMQKNQRASVMERRFVEFWKPLFDYVTKRYPRHSQSFGEIGEFDADGVGVGPSYWDIKHKALDDQETADIWYAYLRGAKELGIESLNLWAFPLGDLWSNTLGDFFLNTGLRQKESPAYRVITAIIKPDGE